MSLAPHGCLALYTLVFGVWLKQLGLPLVVPSSSSTPNALFSATVPKDLSGRTSYLQVRLAYYRYPQVIRTNCNLNRFGLPPRFHEASPCSWMDHLVSGQPHTTI